MPAPKTLFSLDNATVTETKRQKPVESEPLNKIVPRAKLPEPRFYVQTNNGRKPLENYNPHLEKDIQKLANQRQQMISRYIGKVLDEFHPAPPASLLLFIEDKDGSKTLLKSIKKPSPEFITKCEDYADKHQNDLSVHYPDGLRRWIPCLDPKDRESYREKPPQMSTCRRCGSETCGGIGSTGVPCQGRKHTETPTPAPPPVTPPAPVTKPAAVEVKPAAVKTKTPPMIHATQAWRRAAVQRNLDRGIFCFKKIAEFTGIPEEHVLPIFIEKQPAETKRKPPQP